MSEHSISYLLFNSSHDVLFHHLRPSLAKAILPPGEPNTLNSLMQIFSPLLTSHRVLKSHLGQGYERLTCLNGYNLVLNEYNDNVLILISQRPHRCQIPTLDYLKKLCGPNPEVLRTSSEYNALFKSVLDEMEANEDNLMWVFNAILRLPSVDLHEKIHQVLKRTLLTYSASMNSHLIYIIAQQRHIYPIVASNSTPLHPSDVLFILTLSSRNSLPPDSFLRQEHYIVACYSVLLRTKVSPLSPHTVYVVQVSQDIKVAYVTEPRSKDLGILCLGLSTQIGLLSTNKDIEEQIFVSASELELLDISGKTILERARPPRTHPADYQRYVHDFASLSSTLNKSNPSAASLGVSKSILNLLKRWFNDLCLNTEESLRKSIGADVKTVFESLKGELGGEWSSWIQNMLLHAKKEDERMSNPRAVSVLKSIKNLESWAFIHRSRATLLLSAGERFPSMESLIAKGSPSILQLGNLTVFVNEGETRVAYFLWFEDEAGHILKVSKSKLRKRLIRRTQAIRLFSEPFYKEILRCIFQGNVKDKVHIFELITVFK